MYVNHELMGVAEWNFRFALSGIYNFARIAMN